MLRGLDAALGILLPDNNLRGQCGWLAMPCVPTYVIHAMDLWPDTILAGDSGVKMASTANFVAHSYLVQRDLPIGLRDGLYLARC